MERAKRLPIEALPAAPQDRLRVETHDGLVTLVDHENRPAFTNCYFGLELADGTHITTEGITPVEEELEDGTYVLRYLGDETRPGFNAYYRSNGGAVEMQLGVDNTTDKEVRVKRFIVLESKEGFLETPVDEVMHSQMGYQAQGRIHRPRRIKDQEFQAYSERRPECQLGQMPDPNIEFNSTAPWMTRIQTPDGQMALVGFLRAHRYKSHLEFNASTKGNGHRFTAVNNGEEKVLKKDRENFSEPLLIMTGTVEEEHDMLLHYRDRVAEINHAKPILKNIKGWGSWYREYPPTPNINEEIIIRNADAAGALCDELGLEYFQIDDGRQIAIGQWPANAKFPDGDEFLTSYIKSTGLIPGDWIVPFVADNTSWVFQNHPEWFIKDQEGNPKAAKYHGGWEVFLYPLDPTNKDAAEWMKNELHNQREAGYRYSKDDFVYLTAEEGEAFDPDATGVERLRMSMQMTAEAYEDAELLGCQIPFLMAVGLVGANRVGHDIKPIWDEGISHNHSSLKYAVMAVQELWWMNGEPDTGKGWRQNDPDCIIAREHNFSLTDDERLTWLTTVLLANGVFKLSDGLTELEPEGLEKIKRIFELQEQLDGMTARPMGPYTKDGLSELMLMPRPNAEGVTFGALFNWDQAEKGFLFDPQQWKVPEGQTIKIVDQWTGQEWITNEPFYLPPTPLHGTRLLTVQAFS